MLKILFGAFIGMIATVVFEAVAVYWVLIRDKRKLNKENV